MKSIDKLLIILLLLFCPILANAQTRPAKCRIFQLSVNNGGGRSSYSKDIGTFVVEGNEGQIIHSFVYRELVITTGVDYVFDYSKRKQSPSTIDLAIAVSDKEVKSVFESLDSSEASTFDEKDGNLTVTKNVKFDNATYMFTLSCSDGLRTPRRK